MNNGLTFRQVPSAWIFYDWKNVLTCVFLLKTNKINNNNNKKIKKKKKKKIRPTDLWKIVHVSGNKTFFLWPYTHDSGAVTGNEPGDEFYTLPLIEINIAAFQPFNTTRCILDATEFWTSEIRCNDTRRVELWPQIKRRYFTFLYY